MVTCSALDGLTPAIEGGRSVCPSTMGGSGLLVKSAQSPGNHKARSAAAGLGKLCNVCRHRCMGVPAWREGVAEWVGPIHRTERARIGATVQSRLYSAGMVSLTTLLYNAVHRVIVLCQLRSTFT